MKRSGFLRKATKPMKRAKIRVAGKSETADVKKDIQATLREIVIKRDKKCILHGLRCNHEVGMEGIVWQAEHLIERSNTGTFADPRLVVLVCRNCHGWKHFKKSNHDQYDRWVKTKLPPARVKLWEEIEEGMFRTKPLGPKTDLKLELVVLRQQLAKM